MTIITTPYRLKIYNVLLLGELYLSVRVNSWKALSELTYDLRINAVRFQQALACICRVLPQSLITSLDRCIVIERLSSKASINSKKGIFKSLAILRKVSSVGDIPPLNHFDQLLICIPVRCLKSLYESCKNFSLLVDSQVYILFTAILACVTIFTNVYVMLLTNLTYTRKHIGGLVKQFFLHWLRSLLVHFLKVSPPGGTG